VQQQPERRLDNQHKLDEQLVVLVGPNVRNVGFTVRTG
jgi:hypothetical protein